MKPRVLRCFNGFPENHGMFEIIMIYHDIWNPLKSPKAYPGENPPDIFMFQPYSAKKNPMTIQWWGKELWLSIFPTIGEPVGVMHSDFQPDRRTSDRNPGSYHWT
jgi:hypothetical protein